MGLATLTFEAEHDEYAVRELYHGPAFFAVWSFPISACGMASSPLYFGIVLSCDMSVVRTQMYYGTSDAGDIPFLGGHLLHQFAFPLMS